MIETNDYKTEQKKLNYFPKCFHRHKKFTHLVVCVNGLSKACMQIFISDMFHVYVCIYLVVVGMMLTNLHDVYKFLSKCINDESSRSDINSDSSTS